MGDPICFLNSLNLLRLVIRFIPRGKAELCLVFPMVNLIALLLFINPHVGLRTRFTITAFCNADDLPVVAVATKAPWFN